MSSQPLSYEGLKCVLQYMNVNKRILVACICLAIRTTERTVPLRGKDHLRFSTGRVILSNAYYTVGMYRHYPLGEAPPAIKRNNDRNDVHYEVDRFGIEDRRDKYVVMPGDVEMEKEEEEEERHFKTDDEIIRKLEGKIRKGEAELRTTPDEFTERCLEDDRAKLSAHQYRRYNLDPPYEHFIQITAHYPEEKLRYTARYRYNKKLSDAMRQLATFLFGKRRQPVFVNSLSVRNSILRLPVGVQFQVNGLDLMLTVATGLKALEPIIHESSFPLKNFMSGQLKVADLTIPTIREAGSLEFLSSWEPEQAVPLFMNASNQRLILTSLFDPISSEGILTLVEHCVREGRPTGTHFSFDFSEIDEAKERVRMIRNRFNELSADENHIIIPMRERQQLKVFYDQKLTSGNTWNLHMVVEAAEQN